MGDISRFLKLFFILFICTAIIFSLSHFGPQAYTVLNSQDGLFLSGTMVASVNLQGKTDAEAIKAIEKRKQDWLKHSEIILHYKENALKLNMIMFQFFPEQTITTLKNGQKNPIRVSLNPRLFEKDVQSVTFGSVATDSNFNHLKSKLIDLASLLKIGKFDLQLDGNGQMPAKSNDVMINESIVNPKQYTDEVKQLESVLTPMEIPPQSSFSLLEYCQKKGLTNMQSKSISLIASGIYRTVLGTDFSILERNIGFKLPDYVELGYEAKIDQRKNLDFIFANSSRNAYKINFVWRNGGMHVQLIGKPLLYTYLPVKEGEQHFSPKTVIQYSPLLPLGKSKLEDPGKDGVLVKLYREQFEGNNLMKKELIAEDFYPPANRVEVVSMQVTNTKTVNTSGAVTPGGMNSLVTNSGEGTTGTQVLPKPAALLQQKSILPDLSNIPSSMLKKGK